MGLLFLEIYVTPNYIIHTGSLKVPLIGTLESDVSVEAPLSFQCCVVKLILVNLCSTVPQEILNSVYLWHLNHSDDAYWTLRLNVLARPLKCQVLFQRQTFPIRSLHFVLVFREVM